MPLSTAGVFYTFGPLFLKALLFFMNVLSRCTDMHSEHVWCPWIWLTLSELEEIWLQLLRQGNSGAVVLNLWVATPLGSSDPLMGVV